MSRKSNKNQIVEWILFGRLRQVGLFVGLLCLAGGSGCSKKSGEPALAVPVPHVTVGQPSKLATTGVVVTAAAAGPEGTLALGTPDGQVMLWKPGGSPLGLAVPPKKVKKPAAEGADKADKKDKTAKEPVKKAEGEDTQLVPRKAIHDGPVVRLVSVQQGKGLASIGGKVAALWDASRRAMVRQIGGPLKLTALTNGGQPNLVYFATDQGHVLRWKLAQEQAEEVKELACGASLVMPPRLKLPVKQRCPYGTHMKARDGRQICLYPITRLLLQDGWLHAACRSGTLGLLELSSGTRKWATPGHLAVTVAAGKGLTMLGRADGRLDLYQRDQGAVIRSLEPAGEPRVAVSRDELLAVAQKGVVRLWHSSQKSALAQTKVTAGVVWMRLSEAPDRLEILQEDGRYLVHPLQLENKK